MCEKRDHPGVLAHAIRVSDPSEFVSLPREYLGQEIRYESMMTDDDHPLRTFFELRPCPGMGLGVFVRPDFVNTETAYDAPKKRKKGAHSRRGPCQGVPAGTVIPYGLGKDVSDTGPDDSDEYAIRVGDRIISFAHDRTLASFVNDPRGTDLEANSIIVGDCDTARISIQLTRTVERGEQILVSYGDEFWKHDHSRPKPKPSPSSLESASNPAGPSRPSKPVVVERETDPRSDQVYAHYFSPRNHYPNFLQYNTMHGANGTRGGDFLIIDRSYRESLRLHECLVETFGDDYLGLRINYCVEMWSFLEWEGVFTGPLTLRMHKMCLRGWPFNGAITEPEDPVCTQDALWLPSDPFHDTSDTEIPNPSPVVPVEDKTRHDRGLGSRKRNQQKKRSQIRAGYRIK
jgi:hypothetical protein